MRRMTLRFAVAGLATLPSVPLLSADQVQIVPFVADQVVPLSVAFGFAASVELSPEETVESIVVGDSGSWQVTPTRKGDQLVVKPIGAASSTNLLVSTTQRKYLFLLSRGDSGPYILRFSYQPPVKVSAPPSVTSIYRFRGLRALYPREMFDDGGQTIIRWDPETPMPAVFAVDARGHEALVNGRMVGGAFYLQQTSEWYAFRRGDDVAYARRRQIKSRDR